MLCDTLFLFSSLLEHFSLVSLSFFSLLLRIIRPALKLALFQVSAELKHRPLIRRLEEPLQTQKKEFEREIEKKKRDVFFSRLPRIRCIFCVCLTVCTLAVCLSTDPVCLAASCHVAVTFLYVFHCRHDYLSYCMLVG